MIFYIRYFPDVLAMNTTLSAFNEAPVRVVLSLLRLSWHFSPFRRPLSHVVSDSAAWPVFIIMCIIIARVNIVGWLLTSDAAVFLPPFCKDSVNKFEEKEWVLAIANRNDNINFKILPRMSYLTYQTSSDSICYKMFWVLAAWGKMMNS